MLDVVLPSYFLITRTWWEVLGLCKRLRMNGTLKCHALVILTNEKTWESNLALFCCYIYKKKHNCHAVMILLTLLCVTFYFHWLKIIPLMYVYDSQKKKKKNNEKTSPFCHFIHGLAVETMSRRMYMCIYVVKGLLIKTKVLSYIVYIY